MRKLLLLILLLSSLIGFSQNKLLTNRDTVLYFDYFDPTKIMGLKLWFVADSASLGSLSQWNDESGNNKHATSVTAAKQPVCSANGLNGHRVVTFDGSNDSLMTGTNTISGNKASIFLAVKTTEISAYQGVVAMGVYNSTGSFGMDIIANQVNGVSKYSGASGADSITNLKIGLTSPNGIKGDVAEIIVYSGALSNSDRQRVELYLRSYYTGIY